MEVRSRDPFVFITHESRPFRRFVAKFLLAVPALLTLAVSVRSQGSPELTSNPLEKEYDARVQDYVDVMQVTPAATGDQPLSYGLARTYARRWIQGFESGALKPLSLTKYQDSMFEGASGQIIQASYKIAGVLLESAATRASNGDAEGAVEDALSAMKICRGTQYSDPLTNSLSGVRYRRGLWIIRMEAPALSPKSRSATRAAIASFRTDRSKLTGMLLQMYNLYVKDASLNPEGRLTLAQVAKLQETGHLPSRAAVLELVNRSKTATDKPGRVGPTDQFLALAERTVENDRSTDAEVDQTIAKL